LCALLGIEDLDDLSDAGSMIRYLVECVVMYDHEAYSDQDVDDMVVGFKMHETCISESDAEAAKALDAMRKVLTKAPADRRYPPEPEGD
jgi:predicted ATP-grasp superfamily ATP-dependent carboligase